MLIYNRVGNVSVITKTRAAWVDDAVMLTEAQITVWSIQQPISLFFTFSIGQMYALNL